MAALLSTLIFTIVELALIVGLSELIYVAVTRGLERAMSGRSAGLLESTRRLRLRIRNVLIVTTKVRDGDGRLHVVRNGDVKQVINYSKQYALAVVAFEVPYHADL
jgi:hypothetical protein